MRRQLCGHLTWSFEAPAGRTAEHMHRTSKRKTTSNTARRELSPLQYSVWLEWALDIAIGSCNAKRVCLHFSCVIIVVGLNFFCFTATRPPQAPARKRRSIDTLLCIAVSHQTARAAKSSSKWRATWVVEPAPANCGMLPLGASRTLPVPG